MINKQSKSNYFFGINLIDLLWDALSQWKAIIVFSLIVAAATCALKYKSDLSSYQLQLQAKEESAKLSELSVEEQIEKVKEVFSDEERTSVEYVVNELEWAEAQQKYLEESILLSTDLTNQKVLILKYTISSADDSNNALLLKSYYDFLHSEEQVSKIREIIEPNADNKYVEELFLDNIEDKEINSTGLEVYIVLPDNANEEAVKDTINSIIDAYRKEVADRFPHSINNSSAYSIRVNNEMVAAESAELIKNINNIVYSTKDQRSNMSDIQNAAIDAILAIKREASSNEDKAIGPEDQAQTPNINKKYALLGLILGIAIYIMMYIAVLAFKNRINSANDVEDYSNIRLLGEIYRKRKHKGIACLFHSNIVNRFRYREKIDCDEQVSKIKDAIDAVCKHYGIDRFSIINASRNEQFWVNNEEKELPCFDEINAINHISDKDLLEVKHAIINIGKDTRIELLEKVIALCAEYDTKVIGLVYNEEI